MPDFNTKMHQNRFRTPDPAGGAYSAPSDLVGFKGLTSKGRGGGAQPVCLLFFHNPGYGPGAHNILTCFPLQPPTSPSLSILTAIYPGGPGLGGTRRYHLTHLDFVSAKDDGDGCDNQSYKTWKAAVKSPPTNQHPTFYRPDALPITQGTVYIIYI